MALGIDGATETSLELRCATTGESYVDRPRAEVAREPKPLAGVPDRCAVLPLELHQLLHGADPQSRDSAWAAFVSNRSRLLLYVARSVASEHDAAMDGYAYVLEQLRQDGFRRLRGYEADGRSAFTTWLVVVARRLCLDFHRHRYGRAREKESSAAGADQQRAARRRLVDLAASAIDLRALVDEQSLWPDAVVRMEQLHEALDTVLHDLPADDRLLIKLRFEDDLSAQEIATILNRSSPFQVYRQLNALYAELRQRLLSRGIASSVP
jgi:RNA polymerase sigma factor (sigma-70 family)